MFTMLDALRTRIEGKRLVILGVGNPLRGDDGVGPALVERLRGRIAATLIDAGDVPENYIGLVAAAKPEAVLIVDAVELNAAPGDVALLEIGQLGGEGFATHNAGLGLVARVLQEETDADVLILAIQPQTTGLGASLSPPVEGTLRGLEEWFREWAM